MTRNKRRNRTAENLKETWGKWKRIRTRHRKQDTASETDQVQEEDTEHEKGEGETTTDKKK